LSELRRALGLLDATMVNVGVMIGSAVFLTASDVARVFPHPLAQLAAWVVAALFSLAGALTIAELSAALPEAGGLSVYLDRAFGPFWGFFYGWALFVVIQTASIAAVAVAFASYFGHFVSLSPRGAEGLAICAIAALTLVNVLGVREGVVTQNVMTFAKMAVIAGLIFLAFGGGRGGSWSHLATPSGAPAGGLAAMGAALVGPLFAFDGWITISYMGGEVKRPARNLPLAALASVAIVAAIYLALNAAYLYVLGSSAVARSELVAADTARVLLGERGADLAAGMVALATLGGLNGNVLGGARVLYAMAHAGVFWRPAAQVHPRFGTPAIALAVQGAVSMAFVLTGRFEQLIASVLFASWLFYAMGGVAVFVLRRDRRLERPYSVPGYPLVPALFIVFAALLLASTLFYDPRDSLLGTALLLTAVPVYLIARRKREHH
jgi:APA family basic amino acid/polyamine antiporter